MIKENAKYRSIRNLDIHHTRHRNSHRAMALCEIIRHAGGGGAM